MDTSTLYRRYLTGRLGVSPDLRGLPLDELAAHALGEQGRGANIHSARQVAESVEALVGKLADAPAAPEAEVPAAPRVSARAAESAARRASIAKLASEGRSPAEIARELELDPSTVYGHLRALRAGGRS